MRIPARLAAGGRGQGTWTGERSNEPCKAWLANNHVPSDKALPAEDLADNHNTIVQFIQYSFKHSMFLDGIF